MDKVATKLSFIRDHYIDAVIGKEIFPIVTSISLTGNPIAIVCDFFLRKAIKSLDAVCLLCEMGFAEDALVLGRTIFELSLYLQIIASSDSIEQRRWKAECFIYDGDRQRVTQLKKLEILKKQGRCLSWIEAIDASKSNFETILEPNNFVSPKSIKDMAIELGGKWECWYHSLYWSMSKLTHPSGLGSNTYIKNYDQELEASGAIKIILAMHYFLTDCTLNILELERLRPQLDECMKSFRSLSECSEAN